MDGFDEDELLVLPEGQVGDLVAGRGGQFAGVQCGGVAVGCIESVEELDAKSAESPGAVGQA